MRLPAASSIVLGYISSGAAFGGAGLFFASAAFGLKSTGLSLSARAAFG